jgi:hypothetical protein
MLIELSNPLPVYIPEFDREGYAFALESFGMENYLMFHIIVDGSGEIWSLDNTRVRGCINYSARRPEINKDLKSVHLDKLKNQI